MNERKAEAIAISIDLLGADINLNEFMSQPDERKESVKSIKKVLMECGEDFDRMIDWFENELIILDITKQKERLMVGDILEILEDIDNALEDEEKKIKIKRKGERK